MKIKQLLLNKGYAKSIDEANRYVNLVQIRINGKPVLEDIDVSINDIIRLGHFTYFTYDGKDNENT